MAYTKRPIRSFLRRYLPFLAVFGKGLGLLYSRRSMLRTSGYIKSVATKRPLRADGTPIPWMTYNAITFFEERLTKDLSIFEYGSGNSTMFFANLVGKVTSAECDESWYEHVRKDMPENVNLMLVSKDGDQQYCKVIGNTEERFDVIIVDAEDRVECLKEAPNWVTGKGVIVLDDAEREAYRPGIEHVLASGFRHLDFEGLKPGGIRAYRTSIYYRDNNCLGI